MRLEAVRSAGGQECRAAVLDITERHAAELEKSRLIDKLQQAQSKVEQLSGLLPICAHCKKIRDGHGHWEQVESYIMHHSRASFSHGICPECMVQYYPNPKNRQDPSR